MAKRENAVTSFLKSKPGQYIIAGSIAALVGWYLYNKAKGSITETLQTDLNPASDKNLVNSALSSVGKDVTGNQDFQFDDWLSRLFGQSAAEKQVNQEYGANQNAPLNSSEKVIN